MDQQKWLNVMGVMDALKAKTERDARKVMITFPKSRAPYWLIEM